MNPTDDSERPAENEAVEAARRMNEPTGPQPGVTDDPPELDETDPLPEMMQ